MTDSSPSPGALDASLEYAAAGNLLHKQLALAFDEFARQAVERERARCGGIAAGAVKLVTAGPDISVISAKRFAADLARDIEDGIRQGIEP